MIRLFVVLPFSTRLFLFYLTCLPLHVYPLVCAHSNVFIQCFTITPPVAVSPAITMQATVVYHTTQTTVVYHTTQTTTTPHAVTGSTSRLPSKLVTAARVSNAGNFLSISLLILLFWSNLRYIINKLHTSWLY